MWKMVDSMPNAHHEMDLHQLCQADQHTSRFYTFVIFLDETWRVYYVSYKIWLEYLWITSKLLFREGANINRMVNQLNYPLDCQTIGIPTGMPDAS